MNADIAREMTKKSLQEVSTKPLIDAAHAKIKEAAQTKGRSSIVHPFYGAAGSHREANIQAAINILQAEGFRVQYHDDPDPGHPCSSGGYYEVSW